MVFTILIAILIFFLIGFLLWLWWVPYRANHPWWFRKKMHHQDFGLIWYCKAKGTSKRDYWQAHFLFEPAGKEIDFLFDAPESGISKLQERLLHRINKNYATYKTTSLTRIALEYDSSLSACVDDLDVFAFELLNQETNKDEWKMLLSCTTEDLPYPHFSVKFLGDKLISVDKYY